MNTTPKAPNEKARIELPGGWYVGSSTREGVSQILKPDGKLWVSTTSEDAVAFAAAMNTPPQTKGQAGDGELLRDALNLINSAWCEGYFDGTKYSLHVGRFVAGRMDRMKAEMYRATPAPAAIPAPTVTAVDAVDAKNAFIDAFEELPSYLQEFWSNLEETGIFDKYRKMIDAAKALPAAPQKEEA